MNRIYVLILACVHFLLISLAANGEKKQCSVVYQTNVYDYMVVGVNRTDTTTEIIMRYTGIPGTEYEIPSTKLYLSDDKQNIYRFKYAGGINLNGVNITPYSGENVFSLTFEPLAKDVCVFDILSDHKNLTHFAFWGVHTDKKALRRIKPADDNVSLCEEAFLKPDTVTVVGHIKDYITLKKPDTLKMEINEVFFGHDKQYKRYFATVSSDGEFTFRMPIANRTWAYIDGDSMRIPVFMTPSDTLFVSIDCALGAYAEVRYASAKGYDVMAGLMKADPRYYDHRLNRNGFIAPHHPEELNECMKQGLEESRKLADYLSWKYKLSKVESHLLRTNMKCFWYCHMIQQLNMNFLDVFLHDGGYPIDYVDSVRALPEIEKSYDFVKNIAVADYSYFLLPYQAILNHLSRIEPVIRGTGRYEGRKALERYLGQELDDEWIKRLSLPNNVVRKIGEDNK